MTDDLTPRARANKIVDRFVTLHRSKWDDDWLRSEFGKLLPPDRVDAIIKNLHDFPHASFGEWREFINEQFA